MTNYKLLLCVITKEWYLWGNITIFHLFYFNMKMHEVKYGWVYNFLFPMYFVYQNLFCGTLICPLSILQLGLINIGMYLINRVNTLLTLFLYQHNYIIQNRLLFHTHWQQDKQVFENWLFNCVTRPDLSGVPLLL